MNKIKISTLLFLTLVIPAITQGQRMVAVTIISSVNADAGRLVGIFKDLHANPELGFSEKRTAGIVAKELKALGYEVKKEIEKTGVAGILENGNGPTLMFRADMNGNAVKEITGLPYASSKIVKREDGTKTPVMHACGHDAQITWLLGIAKFMAANKDLWSGTLVLTAQSEQESNDGLYENIPEPVVLFTMHSLPIPLGMAGTIQRDPQMDNDLFLSSSVAAEIVTRGFSVIIPDENISTNASEGVHHLAMHDLKYAVCNSFVGVADPDVFEKAVAEGKEFPYVNQSGNYMVDISAIPLGTKLGVSALLELFTSLKNNSIAVK